MRLFKWHILLTVLLVCCTLAASGQQKRISRAQYIEMYSDLAVEQMIRYGIPASITLAQGCFESGDGNSYLAREANNHFGIKCHSGWKGQSVKKTDDAKDECFRKYNSVEDSYLDHSEFLRTRDRYASLFKLERTDYKGWAYGLKKAGYATASDYAERLIKVIEDYNLQRFDRMNTDHVIYKQNGVRYVISEKGDTYAGIAEEFHLFQKELLTFNDLSHGKEIEEGTTVYVERKKGKSARGIKTHLFVEGDTMYDISQRYAVRLQKIYKRNNMTPGTEPEPGTTIYLRKRPKR